jgi:hypothetical protein
MGMEWAQAVTTFTKIAPAPLLGAGIASGFIIFSSDSVAGTLGIDQFRIDNRGTLGAAFILSWAYLAAHSIWWVRGHVVEWWVIQQMKKI